MFIITTCKFVCLFDNNMCKVSVIAECQSALTAQITFDA